MDAARTKLIRERVGRAEFLLPLLLLALFVYLVAQTPSFHRRATFFPLTMGGLGILLTTVELLRQVLSWGRREAGTLADGLKKPAPLRREFWLILGLTVLFLLGVIFIGFYIPAALFIPLSMLVLGVRKVRTLILTTVITLGIVYAVFGFWLYIPLLARVFGK